MEVLKKFIFYIAIIAIAIVDIAIYWDHFLYYKARDLDDYEKRIEILDKASLFSYLNDLVFFELGRAYYERGEDSFGDRELSETSFDRSINLFKRSIRINPASHMSHFYLGKALLSKSLITQSTDNDFFSEYKRAALLVNRYASIYFEVGKLFLSRWKELSQEEKKFTLMMLSEIWKEGKRGKILSLLSIWEINVGDYEVIREILPEDEKAYRQYAKFLGERSLDLAERHHFLAKAEYLEFQKAKEINNMAERDLYYMHLKQARDAFKKCLNMLDKIRFYQSLSDQVLIERMDFDGLRKTVLLNMAKSLIREGKDLQESEEYLRGYLKYDVSASELNDLERYLIDRDLLSKNIEDYYNDFERLSFHLLLYLKQNRYSDIVKLGRSIQSSPGIIPKESMPHYIEILQLVGDAHQKSGSYYTARNFYQMALERDPRNLDTLLRMRHNFELLDDNMELREIDAEIDNLLTPKEIVLKDPTINKGRIFSMKMRLDGREIQMDFRFEEDWEDRSPLVSIFFSGRVVWEDYLKGGVLPLFLKSKPGENRIQVETVNQPVQLLKLTWKTD